MEGIGKDFLKNHLSKALVIAGGALALTPSHTEAQFIHSLAETTGPALEHAEAANNPVILAPRYTSEQPGVINYEVETPSNMGQASVSFPDISPLNKLQKVNGQNVTSSEATPTYEWSMASSSAASPAPKEIFTFRLSSKAKIGSKICNQVVVNSSGQSVNEQECTTISVPYGPIKARFLTIAYFQELYQSSGSFNLFQEVVKPRFLELDGHCNPNNPTIPESKTAIDRPSGTTTVFCAKQNGNYQSFTVPRQSYPFENERHINYSPLLGQLGAFAAGSIGLIKDQYNQAKSMVGTNNSLLINYRTNGSGEIKQYELTTHSKNNYKVAIKYS